MKQFDTLKSLNVFNKIDELKQIEIIFLQNQLNDLIIDKLKEIKQINYEIKKTNQLWFQKILSTYRLLRDIY